MRPDERGRWKDSVAVTREIARLLPQAGWAPVLAMIVTNVLLGVLPVVFVVGTSVLLGRVSAAVAAGTASAEWSAMATAFLAASAAFSVQQALAPVQNALGELVARRIDGRIFDRLIAAALRGPGIGPLEDQRLLSHLSEAGSELEQGVHSPGRACAGLLHLITRSVQLAGYVAVIGLAFSWWAGLGLLVAVMAFRYGLRRGLRAYAEVFPRLAAERRESRYLRGLAMDATAAKEIRVFGLMKWLLARYRKVYLGWIMPVWRERRRLLLWPYLRYTVFGLLVTMAVLASVAAAGARGATLTSLALVCQAVLNGLRLGEFYPEADMQTLLGMNAFRAARDFEQGVAEHLAAEPAAPRGQLAEAPVPRGEIRFDGVSFRYPGRERPVFDDLRLRLPAGKCTAIVGLNGAGKTTLVKLLTRLYEPDTGMITVDGADVRSFAVDAWRARVAVVFQDFNRYEVSAADNIGFGAAPHAGDREEIRVAAKDAGVLDVLEALPQGLDTPLVRHVTGGTDLSGGQWQRVALARALFRLRHGGGILVLDEPTASLDVRAEARFFDEFIRLTSGATTILISHRFSTVRHADHIVVLADGRVGEAGSHEELLRDGGRYADLFRLQAARFTEHRASEAPAGARSGGGQVIP
ncbi:ABC transporter ATP-binding protein [Streptosporangium sp. KLBMP 9127]|nr:ABC transporter ATP-binding protein/permease [Streptosporangium sp. KLBMP 9127]